MNPDKKPDKNDPEIQAMLRKVAEIYHSLPSDLQAQVRADIQKKYDIAWKPRSAQPGVPRDRHSSKNVRSKRSR
jgi:hypothetical protein